MSLFGTLAWPLATLAIALIFRRDVTQALGRVGRFKYRDLEVTFRENLQQAEQLARSIPAPLTPRSPILLEVDTGGAPPLTGQLIVDASSRTAPWIEGREALVKVIARSPREAVEQAWDFVAKALVRVALAMGDRSVPGLSNPDVAARFLVDRGRLSSPDALLVGLLRNLRDRARVDEPPPSPDDAQRFIDLALKVASRIEELG